MFSSAGLLGNEVKSRLSATPKVSGLSLGGGRCVFLKTMTIPCPRPLFWG